MYASQFHNFRRDLIEESKKTSTVSSVTDLRRLPNYSTASARQLTSNHSRTPSREKRQHSLGSFRDARLSRRDRSSRRTLNRFCSRHSKREGWSCSNDHKREEETSFSEGSVKDDNKPCPRKGPNCSRSMQESMDNRRNFGTQTVLCDCSALSTPAIERRRQFAENSGICATNDISCGNCVLKNKGSRKKNCERETVL